MILVNYIFQTVSKLFIEIDCISESCQITYYRSKNGWLRSGKIYVFIRF